MAATGSDRHRAEEFRDKYGPWALVTGASSGIGRETAVELGRLGVHTVLVGRSAESLEAVAVRLRGDFGVQSLAVPADLSTEEGVRVLLDRVLELDVGLLVASAGFGTSGAFASAAPEDELAMLDVNCRAVLALCLRVVPRLVARGRGGVILMSSIVGFQGTPGSVNYAATKAYVQTLAEGLREELRAARVDVLASAPGPVRSGFADRADMRMGRTVDPRTVAVVSLQALGRRTTVAPGALSKILTWSMATLPRSARIRVMGRVMGGFTEHQRSGGPTVPADLGGAR